jgi:hypothetical protein
MHNKNTIQIASYIGIATLNCRGLAEYLDSVQRENFDSHIGYVLISMCNRIEAGGLTQI